VLRRRSLLGGRSRSMSPGPAGADSRDMADIRLRQGCPLPPAEHKFAP
jgi:hypothetical protein